MLTASPNSTPARFLDPSIALPGAELAGGVDRLPSIPYQFKRTTLFHYTDEAGFEGILNSQELRKSSGYANARYGDGQYFTDISPDRIATVKKIDLTQLQIKNKNISLEQASTSLFGNAKLIGKMTHFIEIDVTDLSVRQSLTKNGDKIRNGVQFLLNESSLDINKRIVNSGKTL
jgi:HYD1 signature containing ADP-ribosyltransferase